MTGTETNWEKKFKSAVRGNNTGEIKKCLSVLKLQLPGSEKSVESSAATEHWIELKARGDGGGTGRNSSIVTKGRGDRILDALGNSKETFARNFLRSENRHESAARLRTLGYFTPSFVGDFELVRCMIRSGFRFDEPDPSLSGIDQFRMEGQLKMLNRYLAISDPVYISALFLGDWIDSPVVKCFHLERTFRDLAAKDYEFTTEYDALRRRCKQFGVALLDQCREKRDIKFVLNSLVRREGNEGRTTPLDMLDQAIMNGNDEVRGNAL